MPRLLRPVPPMLVAISLLIPATSRAQSPPDDFVIKLERTACFGECPVYSVTIDTTGNVTFEGQEHVRIKGRATARVAPSRAAALLETAERIGFFSMHESYRFIRNPDGTESMVTDQPTQFVTIIRGGQIKRVEDYFGAPDGLRELERAIDSTAGTKRWVRIDEPTLRQLVRDGWLPSEERGELLVGAIQHDELDVIRTLIELGADPNDASFGPHNPPLMLVRSAAAARILLAAGAMPFATTTTGWTPLGWATNLAPDVTDALLKAGAPPDQTSDLIVETPLWRASCNGNIGVVRLLLAAGANPTAMAYGASALDCVRRSAANARQQRPSPLDGKPPYEVDFDGTIALLEQAMAKRSRR